MAYIIVGLGNPGEEYEGTRHNTGRMIVEAFAKAHKLDDFKEDLPRGKAGKKNQYLKTEDKIGKSKIVCLLPETFMNKSGSALKKIITSKKRAERLIVVHDDIDLALGKFKRSFGKGSAGHRGVESVMRAVKTKDFYRIRVGISSATPRGNLPAGKAGVKKPKGDKLLDFLMKKFKPAEEKILKKITKKVIGELEKIVS